MRAMLPHTEGRAERDGVGLHYEIYGKGPRSILFVPTWALIHSRCWKAQVPYFAEHFRVITYDPRGNGKSDRPERTEAYAVEALIKDVRTVMDATGTKSVTLVGLSFSSAIAFAAAALMPDRVDTVISFGAWTPIVDGLEFRKDVRSEEDPEETENRFSYGFWRKDYPAFCEWFLERLQSEPHSTKQVEDAVG